MNSKPLSLACFLALAVSACTVQTTQNDPPAKELPKPSTDFATNKIYPSTSAQDDGKTMTVFAALLADGKFLTLGSTDKLSAKIAGGPDLALVSQGETYDPHYVVTVPSTPDALDVVITLDRAGTADDAKVALKVPAAFDLDGTLPSDLKQGVAFEVGVNPPAKKDDSLWWAVLEGDCISTSSTAIAAITPAGKLSLTYGANTIKANGAASCKVNVKVEHILSGKADATFSQPYPIDAIGVRHRTFVATIAK